MYALRLTKITIVLHNVECQKCHMLVCVADSLLHEDFADLSTRYPSVTHWFNVPLRHAMAHQTDELGAPEEIGEDILGQSFSEALQHALVFAKARNRRKFAKLAWKTFRAGICPIRDNALGLTQSNIIVEGALSQIYKWHPAPWCIPEDSELSKLEALIFQPGNADQQLPMAEKGVFIYPDTTAHFEVARY
jgi:hypothetical protein